MANPELSFQWAGPDLQVRAEQPEFAAVFRQHFDFVWRALRSFGIPDAGLDDAVQDVFITVHRRLSDFEGRSSLKTWIYAIAYRVAQNHRRGAERRAASPLDTEPVSHAPDPGDRLATAEAGRFVLAFLNGLPPERRDVFALCVLEQLSAPDVAEVLQVNVNTVYSRLRLARADFRAALERFAGPDQEVP